MLDPTNIQELGVIISGFIGVLIAAFSFINAPHKKTARTFGVIGLAIAWWGVFGYLFHVVSHLELARDLRILSLIGNVFIIWSALLFTFFYIKEEHELSLKQKYTIWGLIGAGVPIIGLLISDMVKSTLIVERLITSSQEVLTPVAGPLLILLAFYFVIATATTGVLLWRHMHREGEPQKKKRTRFMTIAIVLALAFGSLGFLPWYGIDFQLFLYLRALAVPMFAVASVYAIANYRFLNFQTVATEISVYGIWTFIFFRIVLHDSFADALPDIFLGFVIVILGVFLIRSAIREVRLQTERMKSEFVSIAAHQLRTPMSAVQWTFDLLSSGKEPLTDNQQELISKGKRAARNMTSIINDLLNVAMVSGGKFGFDFEPEDVRNAITVSVSALEDSAKEKNITLTKDIPDEPLSAYFDIGKFTLAVENLIDNAIKYTPKDGEVKVSGRREKNRIIVEVSDTGIGMNASVRSRLFEKFFRSKEAKSMFPDGSGLGLFIVKTIVEGNKGTMHISSEEGKGTTITIELPARS